LNRGWRNMYCVKWRLYAESCADTVVLGGGWSDREVGTASQAAEKGEKGKWEVKILQLL
jgi:hypothetical protein